MNTETLIQYLEITNINHETALKDFRNMFVICVALRAYTCYKYLYQF